MFTKRVWLTVLLVLSATGPVARAQPREGTFAAVTQAHFAKWAHGLANGTLTPERVDALVNDHRITGEEAAAVAAIHVYFRGQKAPLPLAEAALLSNAHQTGPDERRDQITRPVHLDNVFAGFRKHVQSVPHQLFAGAAPQRDGMSQGRLGDCYVVSVVGALTSHHPDRLKEMFHPHADGSCDVAFPGRPLVRVPRLTDAQIALGSKAGQQGLWLNVMEEAVALASRPANKPAVAMDAISRGGNSGRTIEILTGHRAEGIGLRPAAGQAAKVGQEVRHVLRAVRNHNMLAAASSPHTGPVPPGIVTGHAYGVLGFNAKADTITLWNPWGNTFEPTGEAGLKHGYSTKGGTFTMPVDEFVRVFTTLHHETAAPVAKS